MRAAWRAPRPNAISWDISPDWQIETDPEKTSNVEVRFVAEGPSRTRIELEHRDLDRHGEVGGTSLRRRLRRRVAALPASLRRRGRGLDLAPSSRQPSRIGDDREIEVTGRETRRDARSPG